jgi:hypothetical protein
MNKPLWEGFMLLLIRNLVYVLKCGFIIALGLAISIGCKVKTKDSQLESVGDSQSASYLALVQDLQNNPRCYDENENPLDMIPPTNLAEEGISEELLAAIIKDTASVPCPSEQSANENFLDVRELVDGATPQGLNIDYVEVATIGWKAAWQRFGKVSATNDGKIVLKALFKNGRTGSVKLNIIRKSIMSSVEARALPNGPLLASKSVLNIGDVYRHISNSADVIVPIGPSGALYSESAAVAAKSTLELVFGWFLRKTTILMDFNHEAAKLYDINRLFDEVSKINHLTGGLPMERIGMTTSKVLKDSKYPPNPLEDIKQVLVANAEGYDTGFHTLFASVVNKYKKTNFNVPILGGGAISESQGQAWINALKAGNKNVRIILDINLMAGKPAKYYNAALRLTIANYDVLLSGLSKGNVKMFSNGRGLLTMPSRAELEAMLKEVEEVVANASK